MAQFPGVERAIGLSDPFFRLSNEVKPSLGQQIKRKGQSRKAVGQNAVVNIAAGGEVPGQGRRFLPHFPSASCVLVVAVGERLVPGEPQALDEKKSQKSSRNTLRQIEAKAAEAREPVGHHDQENNSSLNGAVGSHAFG